MTTGDFIKISYMKSIYVLVILFLSVFTSAQKSSFKDNLIIKFSYGTVNSEPKDPTMTGTGTPMFTDIKLQMKSNFGVDVNCPVSSWSDIGIYISYSELSRASVFQITHNGEPAWTYMYQPTKALYYGLNYIYHIPITKQRNKSRIDFYSITKAGLVSELYYFLEDEQTEPNVISSGVIQLWDKPSFEIGTGVGVNYYFTRNLGISTELMAGKFFDKQYFKWKTGVVFKF
jgi:hypothetical protein